MRTSHKTTNWTLLPICSRRKLKAFTVIALGAALALPACAQKTGQYGTGNLVSGSVPSARLADDATTPLFTNETPQDHLILPADLPPPFATPGVNNAQKVGPRPDGASLHLPPGFAVSDWADDLWSPRWLQTAPNGDVFVAEGQANQPGQIVILRPSSDGSPPQKFTFAQDLSSPFGIAFYPNGANPQYVYVGDTDELVRFPYHNGDTVASGPPVNIVALTPGGYNQHWTRTVIVSPDNKHLYIAVGSAANVEDGEQPPRACIMQANPDGSDFHVYASGLRNAVGLTINPVSGAIWAAVNERDQLGDKLPPDYVTSVKPGGFYGWPYYYIGPNHDPRMPDRPDLIKSVIVPDVLLEPHCAALSIEFYVGHMFPSEYYHDGFVVMHGSWNRSDPSGYKVVRLKMNKDGTTKDHGYEDFLWGWKPDQGNVWGRPVSVTFLHDGSMLVSDDGAGKIWRVTYSAPGK